MNKLKKMSHRFNSLLNDSSQKRYIKGANKSLESDIINSNFLNTKKIYTKDASFSGIVNFLPGSSVIGSIVPTLPAPLESIANLITMGDEMIYTIGVDTYATTPITAVARNFVGQTSVANQQAALGLVPGIDVQTQNALLQSISLQSPLAINQLLYSASVNNMQPTSLTTFGRSLIDDANASVARTTLGVVERAPTSNVNEIALHDGSNGLLNTGVTIVTNNLGGALNQVSATTVDTTNILNSGGDLVVESTSIPSAKWPFVAGMQDVATSASPTFAGATMTSSVNMGGNSITSIPLVPVAANEATSKSYVDAVAAAGLNPLEAVQISSIGNLINYVGNVITGVDAQTAADIDQDGGGNYTWNVGDRALIKDQSTLLQNGIYDYSVAAAGTLTRVTGFDTGDTVSANTFVFVESGDTLGGTQWVVDANVAAVGTNDVVWDQFGGTNPITGGDGIDVTGGLVSVDLTAGTPLGITVGELDLNTVTVPFGGTGLATLTSNRVLVGNGVGNVDLTKVAPAGVIVGTTDVQALTNKTMTSNTNNVTTSGLFSNAGANTVSVIASANPAAGSILTATNATTATWQVQTTNELARTVHIDLTGAVVVGRHYNNVVPAITDINAGLVPGGVPTQASPIVILIAPGTYTETSTVTIPTDVTLRGLGNFNSTIIKRNVTTDHVINMSPRASCYYVQVEDATSTGFAGFRFSAAPGSATARIEHCVAQNCDIGFHSAGTGAGFSSIMAGLSNVVTTTTLATAHDGFRADAGGTIDFELCVVSGFFGGNVDNGYICTGDDSLMILSGADANFIDIGYNCNNSAGASISELRVQGGNLAFINTIGANLGLNSVMRIISVYFQDDTATIPNQLHIVTASNAPPNQSIFQGQSLILRADEVVLSADTQVEGIILSTTPGEPLNSVLGELAVGFPARGFETALGEGDSQILGMTIFNADPTDTVFNNITTAVSLSNGTTAAAFQSLNIGERLYIGGSIQQFPGIQIEIDTAGVPAGLNGFVTQEYWNGVAWTVLEIMSTDADAPYLPHAEEVFDLGTYQYRFGSTTGWTQTVVNGVNVFWVRFRLTAGITTIPLIDQIKLHTNHMSINEDGYVEYFGTARTRVRYPFDTNSFHPSNNSPADQDVFVGDNLGVGRVENEFQNSATDRSGLIIDLPVDIDTSFPMLLQWQWTSTNNSSATVTWTVRWGHTADFADEPGTASDVFQTTAAAPATGPNEQSVVVNTAGAGVANKQVSSEANIIICDLKAERSGGHGDTLWVTIERDGTADLFPGNVVVIQVSPLYVKWNEGEFLNA